MFGKEPAAILGAIGSIIALVIAFGLNLTPEQVGSIMAAVSAILALVTRSLVSPAATVVAKLDGQQVVAGPAAAVTTGKPVAVTPV